ncbi:MAG TPA: hypothetical protein VII92_06045 [Anaerolineae bacterium]
MGDAILEIKHPDLRGKPTLAWCMLMATVKYEVHHRSQLAFYLTPLNVPPLQVFGIREEELSVD